MALMKLRETVCMYQMYAERFNQAMIADFIYNYFLLGVWVALSVSSV